MTSWAHVGTAQCGPDPPTEKVAAINAFSEAVWDRDPAVLTLRAPLVLVEGAAEADVGPARINDNVLALLCFTVRPRLASRTPLQPPRLSAHAPLPHLTPLRFSCES